eukprot:TRINITY_DN15538_c0_g2_i1.p1 TRINITY_DN15538_c0_g2~~TRINITY_DN15538_c0_g2_i1.p1  ORF type:complete len:313 (+),score=40.82 TRINITY_DN15538_c0_g2_i1:58-939(+)
MECVISSVSDLQEPTNNDVITKLVASHGPGFKICVYSDLHIGPSDDKANDFKISDTLFVNKLEEDLREVDCIILLGDILELWEISHSHTDSEARYRKIKETRPKFFEFLLNHQNKDLFYVCGNHDAKTSKLLRNPLGINLTLPDTGGSIFATHGHFIDEDNIGSGEWKGRIGTAFRSAAERLVHPDIDTVLMKIADHVGRSGDKKLYSDWGDHLATEFGYSLVIMGHTHKAEISHRGTHHYVNTGGGEEITKKGKVQRTLIEAVSGEKLCKITQKIVQIDTDTPGSSGCCVIL